MDRAMMFINSKIGSKSLVKKLCAQSHTHIIQLHNNNNGKKTTHDMDRAMMQRHSSSLPLSVKEVHGCPCSLLVTVQTGSKDQYLQEKNLAWPIWWLVIRQVISVLAVLPLKPAPFHNAKQGYRTDRFSKRMSCQHSKNLRPHAW